jgi:transposase-like protein
MERRQFTREFKLEAVRLIKDRGVSYTQASADLGVHPTQLRNWVKQLADDPQYAFPGHGQMKPEQLEIAQLKREVARLKAERDILKNCHGPLPACAR